MRWMGLWAVLILSGSLAVADERSDFATDRMEPLLRAKCITCHGPDKQEGGLRLDSRAAALRGGEHGPALVPGKPSESLLIRAVQFTDPDLQMPPKEKIGDDEIAILSQWVEQGAVWPEPVTVLFEDEALFVESLTEGEGQAQRITEQPYAGEAALQITPPQRFSERIRGWNFPIRETPQSGEYRYLQWAWKKTGTGAAMIELATQGRWPDPQSASGRFVAGLNTTEWAARTLSETAPTEWTVVTIDLWETLGNTLLTGIAPTCVESGSAQFDSIILGPSRESLAAYRPGRGNLVHTPSAPERTVGDAFTDSQNPIRQLWGEARLDLWSLRPPAKAPLPHPTSSEHPIDWFIRQPLTAAGLTPSAEADRRTLIRRLTVDLTGLPPTPEAVNAFLQDRSPDAYESLVLQLLESPAYGERQARLWLDVVRYADTHGYERDEFRPLAWRYRDYVVRAFQQDKPFDRFVMEQLAGDEIVGGPPASSEDADALIATGYLQLGQWDSTASIFQESDRLRAEEQADLTNTTAAAFLGLTISCCQCHDHKYDPLLQADHYRLRAFFAGVERRDDLVIDLPAERETINAHNAELDREAAPLKDELAKLDPLKESDQPRHAELGQQVAALEKRRQSPQVTMGATDRSDPPVTHLFYQGDFHSPKEAVVPGFLSLLHPGPAAIEPPHPGTTGRRSTLARWIVAADNPWTSRVFVNRIWQQHFGAGLVTTSNDFGYSGTRPSHPELLDWLAVEFREQGWSVKQLHRLIVTSATYRQASHDHEAARRIDPENRLLWRQNIRRLDAETLRDSLLLVSGLLQTRGGGKPRWPEVPQELLYAQPGIQEALKGEDGERMQGWFTDPVEQTDVRSLYLVRKRCLPIPFLQAFDLPDTTVSCARRDTTVVAPQALMLLNSPDAIRYAEGLAARVATESASPVESIENVFRHVLQRSPSPEEYELASRFLKNQPMSELCRALLNLNEFSYVD